NSLLRRLLIGRHLGHHVGWRSRPRTLLPEAALLALTAGRQDRHASRLLVLLRGNPLQRRLRRRTEQSAAIGAGIIDKLPVIVVVLLVEFPDCLLLGSTRHSHDRSAAKNLAAETGLTWACKTRLAGSARNAAAAGCAGRRRAGGATSVGCSRCRIAWLVAQRATRIQRSARTHPARTSESALKTAAVSRLRRRAYQCVRTGNNAPRDPNRRAHLDFSEVEQLEILPGRGIFVASPQETNVVTVFQFFQPHRIAAILLVEAPNRPGILDSAMNQFHLAVAAHLLRHLRQDYRQHDDDDAGQHHQRDQDVAAFARSSARGASEIAHRLHADQPWVKGML